MYPEPPETNMSQRMGDRHKKSSYTPKAGPAAGVKGQVKDPLQLRAGLGLPAFCLLVCQPM